MVNYIFIYGAVLLYLVSSALLVIRLKATLQTSQQQVSGMSRKHILGIGAAALLLHGMAVFNNIHTSTGFDLSFYNALSVVAVFITFFTLVATWRHPIDILTAILLPISAITVFLGSGLFASGSNILPAEGTSDTLVFHILTSIIAYSLLALAALQAILLSIQNKYLHAHQPGGIIRIMPPLVNMETLLFEVIITGFIALTISLGTGLIFLENMFAQHLAHKTVLSIIAWFVFLTLLVGRWKFGWRGRTAIRWTLTGFVSLMLAYFGSKFVMEIVLV